MTTMTEKPEPSPAIEMQIVENLRRVYNRKLEEEVPDRLLDLLRQLKESDGDRDDGAGG